MKQLLPPLPILLVHELKLVYFFMLPFFSFNTVIKKKSNSINIQNHCFCCNYLKQLVYNYIYILNPVSDLLLGKDGQASL